MPELPRMRTIKEVVEEIKKIDPNTAVREYYVRDLVNNNKIVYVKAGRKILVNLDAFIEFLQQPAAPAIASVSLQGIRKIAE